MPTDLILPLSMAMAMAAWTFIFRWYLHPVLGPQALADAIRPLLLLHAFRYVGLMFLIPGVTATELDPRFALPAAYGDLLTALLAFGALAAFHVRHDLGVAVAWLFNVVGLADLVNAVARGLMFTPDGALGATFWIPATVVPLLVVSHGYIFWLLLRERGRAAGAAGAAAA